MIQSWNFLKEHDNSSDSNLDEDGENSVGINIYTAGPFTLRSKSGKTSKDIDTISISSNSSMLLPLPIFLVSSFFRF